MIATREVELSMVYALVAAQNLAQKLSVAALFHYDKLGLTTGDYKTPVFTATTVATANASNLATSIALANELKRVQNLHIADALDGYGAGVHANADTANAVSTADAATLLAEVQTLLNAIKAKQNAHLTQATVHANNDGTNAVATADASDQTTANALANALKTALNAHMASAPTGHMVRVTAA